MSKIIVINNRRERRRRETQAYLDSMLSGRERRRRKENQYTVSATVIYTGGLGEIWTINRSHDLADHRRVLGEIRGGASLHEAVEGKE